MTRLIFLTAATLLLCSITQGQGRPFFKQDLPGSVQQDGDAKWEDAAGQVTSGDCARLPPEKQAKRQDLDDCLSSYVRLMSQAQTVMRCRMTLQLDRPDDTGRTRIESETQIDPGDERWGAHSLGPHGIHVIGFSSHCVTLPREPASELAIPANCSAEVRGPEPKDDEYPKGIWRRQLDGRTILDYVASKAGRLDEVQVVGSSGSAFVDDAAVDFAQRRLRVRTNCPDQRFRYTVIFRLADAPPPPRPIRND